MVIFTEFRGKLLMSGNIKTFEGTGASDDGDESEDDVETRLCFSVLFIRIPLPNFAAGIYFRHLGDVSNI